MVSTRPSNLQLKDPPCASSESPTRRSLKETEKNHEDQKANVIVTVTLVHTYSQRTVKGQG